MTSGHEHCVAQAYEDSPPRVLDKLRYHLTSWQRVTLLERTHMRR